MDKMLQNLVFSKRESVSNIAVFRKTSLIQVILNNKTIPSGTMNEENKHEAQKLILFSLLKKEKEKHVFLIILNLYYIIISPYE